MAPDTFPKFLQLPKEIQILIWEAAVRPVLGDRHVHRFYIADYRLLRPTPGYNIPGRFLRLLRTIAFEYESVNVTRDRSLAVPADDVAGNPNDSVYMTDSALWTVCRESRRAMERRFPRNEWWSHVKSPFHPKRTANPGVYLGQEGVTHTASYQDNDGAVRHITIDFDKDLIHLDPRYLSDLDWWNTPTSVFLPLFDYRTDDDNNRQESFLGDNIALDYDPAIMDKLRFRTIHYRQKGLEMYSGEFEDMISGLIHPARLTLWFIDYRLVPTSQVNTISKENERPDQERPIDQDKQTPREVFRSNDFIYTEVKREDIGPRWRISDDQGAVGETETPFDMFDNLFLGGLGSDELKELRVLACQPVAGRTPQPRESWAWRCNGGDTCELCCPNKTVPRVPPSTVKRQGSQSSSDISISGLNLFD
ncbi:glutathione s-transferase omega 2 [Fusarium beomiforme]|uniref:Glutathione s-transferase omega 2 n=1 Tax=Fusarium beomiforme TaxID=44412 RepID=A0A9P5AFK1_9HYPO|nr:glutathione s-transferase omega 2 [Fusarium beomiforme]